MKSVGPWPTITSFSPEYEQIEFECEGAAVRIASTCCWVLGVSELSGGPFTSPAEATPALRPATATAQNAAATKDFLPMFSPLLASNVCCLARDATKAEVWRQSGSSQRSNLQDESRGNRSRLRRCVFAVQPRSTVR
jgi:hypothetical protein